MNNKVAPYKRTVLRSLLVLGLSGSLCLPAAPSAVAEDKGRPAAAKSRAPRVQFRDVAAKARDLSRGPFQDPGRDLPEIFKEMGYDQWRGIRFRPADSLWAGQPYSVQFFHPGFLYQHPVTVNYIERDGTYRVPFSSSLFDYDSKELKAARLDDRGFAGLRVHYPLNRPDYSDELVSFLGASYFRALGRGLLYGISARGLAVNTAEDCGEEFPLFREFWVVQPRPKADHITIYALLDSESLAGAYEFEVYPGEETVMKVQSELFLRRPVRKLGVAPLTSMFFFGEYSGGRGDRDFRPEVHDSDGLLVQARSGEWIWHPLDNPPRLSINAFGGDTPLGFGLLQRDTDFDHYQDLEARYEVRPSVWVVPEGDWGRGHLELVQLPTENEYNDNIVAYWVPERELAPGDELRYSYTLSWHSARAPRSALGLVEATRAVKKPDGEMFLVDFSGGELGGLADPPPVPDVWVSRGGRITAVQLIRNPVTGGWRLVLQVQWEPAGLLDNILPNQRPAVEFRAFLKADGRAVTETWSYTYLP